MLWIPPIRLVPIGLRPSAGDISAFAVAASREAEVCQYPGSVDDVPPLWLINHSKRAIGRGQDAYTRASSALEAFECLELSWLTHSLHADALAICSRQFYFLWLMNANRIINDEQTPQQRSFTWATTRRHVLCGEERLTVSYDDASDEVHFEVLSFSRPRHLFSWAAYPYVVAQQKRFARDATERMVTAVERQ